MGALDLFQMPADGFDENNKPGNFDPSGGGTRAATDKHYSQKQKFGKRWPEIEISGAKSGGGQDGNGLEKVIDQTAEVSGFPHRGTEV